MLAFHLCEIGPVRDWTRGMESSPFRLLRNLKRSGEIAAVLIRYGFGDLVQQLGLLDLLNWRKSSSQESSTKPYSRAQRIRMALEELGPTFVKFGQVASTRSDLLPLDVIKELQQLRDQVKPVAFEQIQQVLKNSLDRPIEEVFAHVESTPLAAGSLGQVHQAQLLDGTKVVLKVQRPKVVQTVEQDLELMYELAVLIDYHVPELSFSNPTNLVEHFSRAIRRELRFDREAKSMEMMSRMFQADARLKIPHVYHDLTTAGLLVMEEIEGVRLEEIEQHPRLVKHRSKIARNGTEVFLKQTFEHGFFHCDPHPGNMRLMPDGTLCLLDFGMVGVLEESVRDDLLDLLAAIARRNSEECTELLLRLGTATDVVDKALLKVDVRDFINCYYDTPLSRLAVGQMLTEFLQILSNHHIRCPGSLMLLVRMMVHLEDSGRMIDPQLNVATVLEPQIRKMFRDRYHPAKLLREAKRVVWELSSLARSLPEEVQKTLVKINNNDVEFQLKVKNLDKFITEIDRSSNRLVIGMILAALIVASGLILRSEAANNWAVIPVYTLSSLLGIWLIYGIIRSGRL